jgi:hypothetical protein
MGGNKSRKNGHVLPLRGKCKRLDGFVFESFPKVDA